MKKFIHTFFLFLAFYGCAGNKEEETRVEYALEQYWRLENSQSAVGAIDCNVYTVHLDEIIGDTLMVSYSLRSTYSAGNKVFVNFTGAKIIKDKAERYNVIDCGYNN